MLKKLKRAVKAAEAAEAEANAKADAKFKAEAAYAYAEPSDSAYDALTDTYVAAENAFVDNAAARIKVRKILQKLLARYE